MTDGNAPVARGYPDIVDAISLADEIERAAALETVGRKWRRLPVGSPKLIVAALRAYAQGCSCQDQHRRGRCTEPGCPFGVAQPPSDTEGQRKALQSLEYWCTDERMSIGAVDGYDYRSGEEFGIRRVEIEISKRIKALALPSTEGK
jgi:hypothetical protein